MVIVPALVYLAGFSQHKTTGTSLAILLPPLGIGAVLEYHKTKNVDRNAAITIGILLALGAWLGGKYALVSVDKNARVKTNPCPNPSRGGEF